MKVRTVVLLAIVAFLLAGSAALAQSNGPPVFAQYVVAKGIASGGGYRLASTSWQASGVASGGGYYLLGPAALASSENGCCCTWLPCVLRNHH
jgi:hypothetical protein